MCVTKNSPKLSVLTFARGGMVWIRFFSNIFFITIVIVIVVEGYHSSHFVKTFITKRASVSSNLWHIVKSEKPQIQVFDQSYVNGSHSAEKFVEIWDIWTNLCLIFSETNGNVNPTQPIMSTKILGCNFFPLFRQVGCSLLKLDLYLINLFRFINKRKNIWGSCQS